MDMIGSRAESRLAPHSKGEVDSSDLFDSLSSLRINCFDCAGTYSRGRNEYDGIRSSLESLVTFVASAPEPLAREASTGKNPPSACARKPVLAIESKEVRSRRIMFRLVVVVRQPMSIGFHLWVSFVRCSHGNLSEAGRARSLCESTLLHFLVLPDHQAHSAG
jgi:hypothetical protein